MAAEQGTILAFLTKSQQAAAKPALDVEFASVPSRPPLKPRKIRLKRKSEEESSSDEDDLPDPARLLAPSSPKRARVIGDSDDEAAKVAPPKLFDSEEDEEEELPGDVQPPAPKKKKKKGVKPRKKTKKKKGSEFVDDEASASGEDTEGEPDDDSDVGSLKDFVEEAEVDDDVGPQARLPEEEEEEEVLLGEGENDKYAMYEGPEKVKLVVELRDLYNGTVRTFKHVCGVRRGDTWSNRTMVMTVGIPPRTAPGEFRRLRNSGGYYFDIADQADVIIELEMDPTTPWYTVGGATGLDIFTTVEIDWVDGLTGKGDFLVRDPAEPTEYLLKTLTAPVRNADCIVLSGLGMVDPVSKVKGALMCKADISPPVFSDERLMEAFSKCAKALDGPDLLAAHTMADRVLGVDPAEQVYC